jgi:type II secretory pathway pseudopilin PulG
VELLVVIGIIALLAAIVTPAVMRAQATARNAAIKAEIDMLHMAIMNYKNEYGSFPPCADTTSYASGGPASKHLARLFPRCANPTGTGGNAQFAGAVALTPATALIAWLNGYSTDPSLPLTGGSRAKLYDYDKSRLDTNQLVYFPSGKPGSPYIYVNASEYGNTWPNSAYTYTAGAAGQSYTIASNQYGAAKRTATEYFNPDTFQILCAGRDETFGTDDDLSNFWPGTRKDYADSLTQ